MGSKSEPPLPPPIGMPVSAFLKICSKPRNFTMPRFTEGWNRRPPLYGPSAELNSTRKPRLICTLAGVVDPRHAEDDLPLGLAEPLEDGGVHVLGVPVAAPGSRLSKTSLTAWWNSPSPGLRASTVSRMASSRASIATP